MNYQFLIMFSSTLDSILTGSKPPGPASKTGATSLGKSGGTQSSTKGSSGTGGSGKGLQSQSKSGGAGSKVSTRIVSKFSTEI